MSRCCAARLFGPSTWSRSATQHRKGTRTEARAASVVCVEERAFRPRHIRNQGARTIVTKLTSLRSRNGAVDMDGVGRLMRGYDIQGPMLLDVLVGLKQQDRWAGVKEQLGFSSRYC